MFKISEKTYKLLWFIYTPAIIIGQFSHITFVPSHGYTLFSYLFIWIFAIWLAIVSTPHMQAYTKKKNLLGKNIPSGIMAFLAIILFAHLNALFFFQTVPLITQHISTSDRTTRHAINNKDTRDARAFLACDQYLKLKNSLYYGKLCVTKEFFDSKKEFDRLNHHWDEVNVSGQKNIIGFYINEYH